MNIKMILVVVLMLVGLTGLHAQDSPQYLIDKFFENYEKDGPDKAITELYSSNPWTSRIQDAVDNIIAQMSRFDNDLVGEYYGYEFLTKKQLGDSYMLYAYFIKFDRQFIRLTFQFYKPKDEWRMFSFQFDDNFDDEIEEAAKLYYLDLDSY